MTKQDDGTIPYEGYSIDLLNELAIMLKFTYEIYPSPDGLFGAETETGTWNGMIGELVNEVSKNPYVLLIFAHVAGVLAKWHSLSLRV